MTIDFPPLFQIEDWMTWIPVVFGSTGAIGGGYLSDILSRDHGIAGRLVVLIVSCVIISLNVDKNVIP